MMLTAATGVDKQKGGKRSARGRIGDGAGGRHPLRWTAGLALFCKGGSAMPDRSSPGTPSIPEIQARLAELTQRLRDSATLDPESREALGKLVGELSTLLQTTQVPPAEVAELARTTTHLADSLHPHPQPGMLGKVRDQFEQAVLDAEAHAPVAVGLARRLMETLANLGI